MINTELTQRFKSVALKLDYIYGLKIDQIQDPQELLKIKKIVEEFAYSETSMLSIFNEILCSDLEIKDNSVDNIVLSDFEHDSENHFPKKTAKKELYIYKTLYHDLKKILESTLTNKEFPFYDYKNYYLNSGTTISLLALFRFPNLKNQKNGFAISNDLFHSVEDLIKSIKLNIEHIERFINDVLFFNIKLYFDTSDLSYRKPDSVFNTDFQTIDANYLNGWLGQTITLREWNSKYFFDLWKFLKCANLGNETINKITNHQEKLFNQGLDELIQGKLSELNNCPKESVKKIVSHELNILNNFIEGDFSELSLKKIKQIILLNEPEKVLLWYDILLKTNTLNKEDCYIFVPHKLLSPHPAFIANFLLIYIEHLNKIKKSPRPLDYLQKTLESPVDFNILTIEDKKNEESKLSFQIKVGVKKEKLKKVIKDLCREVYLLDENKSSFEDLYNILISNDIFKDNINIHLGLETTQFRYVLDKLKDYFLNLTPTTIEKSCSFFTKKDILLKRVNLSKNKSHYPKNKEIIDNIFMQMQ